MLVRFIGTHAGTTVLMLRLFRNDAMTIKPIHTEADCRAALAEIEALWDAPEGSAEADQLEVLSMLVEAYEKKKSAFPIRAPDGGFPRLHHGNTRPDPQDLEPHIGPGAECLISSIVVRPLTLEMIRRLASGLGSPRKC